MRLHPETDGRTRHLLLGSVLSCAVLLATVLAVHHLSGAGQRQTARRFRPVQVVPARKAIKNAPVIEADRVRDQVTDTELVLGVVINGEARAYPINMLTGPSREIINDTLDGQAIAATW